MDPYELQSDLQAPMQTPVSEHAEKCAPTVEGTEPRTKPHPLSSPVQRDPPGASDPVLQTLALLQRQQGEQTRLLRQLLHEIELLKSNQSAQHTTVTQLDRRMRRARFFRTSWIILRTAIFVAGIAFIIYIIGIDQIQAMWARLVWLFS